MCKCIYYVVYHVTQTTCFTLITEQIRSKLLYKKEETTLQLKNFSQISTINKLPNGTMKSDRSEEN